MSSVSFFVFNETRNLSYTVLIERRVTMATKS